MSHAGRSARGKVSLSLHINCMLPKCYSHSAKKALILTSHRSESAIQPSTPARVNSAFVAFELCRQASIRCTIASTIHGPAVPACCSTSSYSLAALAQPLVQQTGCKSSIELRSNSAPRAPAGSRRSIISFVRIIQSCSTASSALQTPPLFSSTVSLVAT
jgi:hypothetical protein